MTVTRNARKAVQRVHAAAVASQKAQYARLLRRLQGVFDPPLSNSELSAGLGLNAPTGGALGVSDVGRFLSESPRLRRSRPDGETRALIDAVVAGELFLAAQPAATPGARREVLVCDALDVPWLARAWDVKNLAGAPVPPRRGDEPDWEDDAVWDMFGEASSDPPDRAPAPAPPARPRRRKPPSKVSASSGPMMFPLRSRRVADVLVPPIGFGAMRLSTAGRPDEGASIDLLVAALDAGVRLIDTADVYALDDTDLGHNERLIAAALARWGGAREDVLVATKVGLGRPGGRWIPRGRPEDLRRAAEARLEALGVDSLQLLLLHVKDPTVPWEDSVGALARLREEGKVQHVGLCNVGLDALQSAVAITPIAAVQNKAVITSKAALAGPALAACVELGIPFIAHSPLGGHGKTGPLAKRAALRTVAGRRGVSVEQVALARLVESAPNLVAIPGARRPESLADSMAASTLRLSEADRRALDAAFPWQPAARSALAERQAARVGGAPVAPVGAGEGDVLVVMGPPGSGKTSRVAPFEGAGYVRLNRDERGGKLDDLLPPLRRALVETPRVVLDNTYPTRASRAGVLDAARRAGVPARVLLLETPAGEALYNVCKRMLEGHGRILSPAEMKAARRDEPNLVPPAAVLGWFRRSEEPALDEGFSAVQRVPFARRPPREPRRALILDYDGTLRSMPPGGPPFPIRPEDVALLPGRAERLQRAVADGLLLLGVSNQSGVARGTLTEEAARACFDRTNELLGVSIDARFCPHAPSAGCWCRKPMPGLGVALLEEHGVNRAGSLYVGDRPEDELFAANLGVPFEHADTFFGGSLEG